MAQRGGADDHDLNALDFYNDPSSQSTDTSVAIDVMQLQQEPAAADLSGAMHSGPMSAATAPAAATAAPVSGSMSGSMSAAASIGFGLPENVATSMFSTMLSGAREQAKARGVTGDVNSQIDFLRPYFDVETSEVRQLPSCSTVLLFYYR